MEQIKQRLKEVIAEVFDVEIEPVVTEAPVNIEADYSSNVAMQLAGRLHKSPMEIAEQIREKLGKTVTVLPPGFLNFISPDEYFVGEMREMRADFQKNISCSEYDGKTIIYEFSDPNPFKVLHAGHLYTSVVGDSLARLAEYTGGKVVRANYGGDVGLHVAKTLWAMQQEEITDFDIDDIAKYYVEGNKAYEEDEQAKQEIDELNKDLYRISAEDEHDSELAKMYWYGRELSYKYFEDFYAHIGVKFDKYYPESSVVQRGETEVRKQLKAGVYEESEGAIVFRGEPYGLHTRVFINRAGVPTYEAKEVGLIFTKWDDWKFDESVAITGNEQTDYMRVVLKSIEQYAPELVKKTQHLTHGMVRLPGDKKMSSRTGNGLRAMDVIEMVADKLKSEYGKTDQKVVLGAIKYAFLKYKMGGNIVFDPDESVSMTGNAGPYLQYSCVRARKVIQRSKINVSSDTPSRPSLRGSVASSKSSLDFDTLETLNFTPLHQPERALIKKVVQYRDVLKMVVDEKAPHKLCNYLYELAQEFSRFYENCPVVGDEREAERAQMVAVFLKVMEHGLGLLGIEIPEEM